MTTASVLLTVSSTWNSNADKCDKDMPKVGRSVAAVAARELRETPATREQALRIMRDWLQQNSDVTNVRQDESFLLRFLRHKKYSIPMAQQTLLKYLNLRKFYLKSLTNLDHESPKVDELLSSGYIMVSPVRDGNGRRVIVYSMSKNNPSKYSCWDICRAHMIVYESCLEDPVDQVCGFTHVGDGRGATGAQVTVWNPTDFARLFKWGEQALPMRHKEFHIVNLPTAMRYIIDFAITKLSSKMAQRLKIHSNFKALHQHVDPACLPEGFGGTIATQDMIQYTKRLLGEQRKKLLLLDDMAILSTRGIHSSRNKKINAECVEGSFRKLEID